MINHIGFLILDTVKQIPIVEQLEKLEFYNHGGYICSIGKVGISLVFPRYGMRKTADQSQHNE